MKKYRYDVTGMSCAACVGHVERAANKVLLKLIPKEKDEKQEVKKYDVTVSLLTSSMTIEIEDAILEKIGKDRIDRALTEEITHAGYHVKALEEGKIIEQKDAREAAKQDKRSLRRSWLRWTLSPPLPPPRSRILSAAWGSAPCASPRSSTPRIWLAPSWITVTEYNCKKGGEMPPERP